MKILLTGGGTGGHFYPLIAIAERLSEIAAERKIIGLKLYYMSDTPYDKRALFENRITFVQIPAGKMRLYFSIKNIFDVVKTAMGAFFGLVSMFFIYPDVVISKGGYAAFPAVFAAKFLKIPVVVHESDSFPGRLNSWTAKFAKRVAVSWPEAAEYLPKEKTALSGQPIRKEILHGDPNGAYEYFKFDNELPVILILGGSQGAEMINNAVVDNLPELLKRYQIIHQTGAGKKNEEAVSRARLLMEGNPEIRRYFATPFLNSMSYKKAAGCANLIISRAGSTIFEIASWGIPSILIPITNSNGDHQRKNAYNYARTGACKVIEENNLSQAVFLAEVDKILSSKQRMVEMSKNALGFANHEAALKIAREAMDIAISHYE
ncbi:MAG TPA: UDP-N-acetylglucosamine--N-acetylmuramyl-(pentapeptide) pyrophosphoryl-undecaprenol N-acetylglucosamine transferase [Candidatus Paceibacterota bacterium]|jgi:UDP-N-acetylglucosamine--N-acetylmuramyl-(pentapeptide) pyrophosphoryl-undecaprenol N-acetylglucosamine transferase|nr:UDP-N-acetylglucosamine--N-acetylmuramyl-(pentapeptide) pyrophosphoryl-undecaprenol N-acetylglucosamine transferase [Candidatus Paceibacterota bacterium]